MENRKPISQDEMERRIQLVGKALAALSGIALDVFFVNLAGGLSRYTDAALYDAAYKAALDAAKNSEADFQDILILGTVRGMIQ